MKMKSIYALLAAMMLAFAATSAWPQATLTRVEGKVTDGSKPLADVQVVLTHLGTGKPYKGKTDKGGSYILLGLVRGDYSIEVLTSGGEGLYKNQKTITGEGGALETLNIDVSAGGGSKTGAGQPKISKEELERIKAENSNATNINALINQYQAASQAHNWPEAEAALKQMIAADPNRWEYYQALGTAQTNQKEYLETIDTYEKGIQVAQNVISGTIPKDPHNPYTEPAKAKAGIRQMLGSEGTSYLKLNKSSEAVVVFTKAAEMDPNPG